MEIPSASDYIAVKKKKASELFSLSSSVPASLFVSNKQYNVILTTIEAEAPPNRFGVTLLSSPPYHRRHCYWHGR